MINELYMRVRTQNHTTTPGYESYTYTASVTRRLIREPMYALCRMFRPEIDDEIQESIESLTSGEFAVKESKVSFNDRLRRLIDMYEDERKNSPFK